MTADRSLSFGAQAAAYERGRPSYPPEAIDWLLPTGARDVLDLGAGTGKLTTRLVERGLNVVAVDPIAEMLEVLSTSLPDTPALLGTAEDIPLPDDSVDAVLVAQAWHWVDPERAVPEVARVLRPGGRLGLVWNTRDERLGWVKELGDIIGHEDDPFNQTVTLPPPFADLQRHQVEWTNYLTPQAVVDLVASRSYCITSPAEVRTRTLHEVRNLLTTHPALSTGAGAGPALCHGERPGDIDLTGSRPGRPGGTFEARVTCVTRVAIVVNGYTASNDAPTHRVEEGPCLPNARLR